MTDLPEQETPTGKVVTILELRAAREARERAEQLTIRTEQPPRRAEERIDESERRVGSSESRHQDALEQIDRLGRD